MLNKVILMGRLTRDPEMRQTVNGVLMCRFSVAVDRQYTSRETGQREADFINVVAWRGTADFVGRFFTKGSMIIVEGNLRNNNYTDQNGVKHYSMDVYADNVSFGETRKAREANQQGFYNNSPDTYQNSYQNNNYQQGGYQSNYQGNQGGNQSNGYQNNEYQNPNNNQSAQGNGFSQEPADTGLDLGDLGDFEEIISDGEVPF